MKSMKKSESAVAKTDNVKHYCEYVLARGSGKSRLAMAGMLSVIYNNPLEDMLKMLFEIENEIRNEDNKE